MNTTDIQELLSEGYQEDKATVRSFERRYALITIPGLIGFVPGFYLIFGQNRAKEGIIIAGICFAVLLFACIHAYFAIPRSMKSGFTNGESCAQ